MQPWENEGPYRSYSDRRFRTRVKWMASEFLFGLGIASIIYAKLVCTAVRGSFPKNPSNKK